MTDKSLPDARFLAINDILRFIPIGRTTLFKMIKDGRFPKPFRLGRFDFWHTDVIQQYIDNLGKES